MVKRIDCTVIQTEPLRRPGVRILEKLLGMSEEPQGEPSGPCSEPWNETKTYDFEYGIKKGILLDVMV